MAERLEAGASIEAIAREVGRDPSTVSYWVRKHGLTSSHAERHAARGPIDRELLAEIVAASSRSATWPTCWTAARPPSAIGCAATAWRPPRLARARSAAAARRRAPAPRSCLCPRPRHRRRHVRRAEGFRCARCRVEHVARQRRRRSSGILVLEAGGRACCAATTAARRAAVPSRRPDPEALRAQREGVTRSLAKPREEAAKCVLLCANCHAEVESGLARLPLRSADRPVYPA